MNPKTTLPISEARKKIFKIAKEVQKPSNYYTLTEKGKPRAIMMSVDEFESWRETLEVIKDFPDLEEETRTAEADYREGRYKTLEDILAKEGFVAVNSDLRKHEISSRSTKKGSKRPR